MKVRVYHAGYGCDTGCCGHILELDGNSVGQFDFMHNYDGLTKEEIIELAKSQISRYHPECLNSIDWDNIEIDIERGCW